MVGEREVASGCARAAGRPLSLVAEHVAAGDAGRLTARLRMEPLAGVLEGHFPGRPLVPAVLLCEALVQAGGRLLRRSAGAGLVLRGLRRVRFRRPVEPADDVHLEVALLGRHGPLWRLGGRVLVGGEVAVEGEIRAAERGEAG